MQTRSMGPPANSSSSEASESAPKIKSNNVT
eukprot:CAMPEP_0177543276 /NCGR_PEP_ID=MMETSP0369-20130122/61285_1 /TAXON_ID=447022 ORGANISM="Scrippsiella hangoei-like, Strain SHHI-4" /NCGR_SAMPLE_ID=MMETSP0369 /ASSEMBLY_ACC=CAM_ASM_000364 /LENGTH=30 /DNA_ID= /DNA_START= /DNA_END= /DNA_ORIENTATION=